MALIRISASWAARISATIVGFLFSLLHLSTPAWAKEVRSQMAPPSVVEAPDAAGLIAALSDDDVFQRRFDTERAPINELVLAEGPQQARRALEAKEQPQQARRALEEKEQPQQARRALEEKEQPQQARRALERKGQPQQARRALEEKEQPQQARRALEANEQPQQALKMLEGESNESPSN